MKTRKKEVVVDLFCGAGGESQRILYVTPTDDGQLSLFDNVEVF